jgi:hypothetical protein
VLNVAQTLTLPPVPGTQSPPNLPIPRVQTMLSTGTLTAATGTLASNNGGLYIGTIPGGAWIDSVEIFCYAALSGGSATSVGIFYTPADNVGVAPGYQPSTLYALGYITTPAAATLYTSHGVPGSNAVTPGTRVILTGGQTGPGTGPTGSAFPTILNVTLASNGPPGGEGFPGLKDLLAGGATATPGDIDLYFVNFLVGGSGTVNTAGMFSAKIEYTGLVG